jgi:hypothetical protein
MPADGQKLYFLALTRAGPRHILMPLSEGFVSDFPNGKMVAGLACPQDECLTGVLVVFKDENVSQPVFWSGERTCVP